MPHSFGSIDELGEGYGFRKVRQALGVEAFGVNAIVYPPGLRGLPPLPRRPGRALLRPLRHRALRGRGRGAGPRPRRPLPRAVDDAAQGVERGRGRPRAARRRRQGRLRLPRRPARQPGRGRRATGLVRALAAGGYFAALTNAEKLGFLTPPAVISPDCQPSGRDSSLSRNQRNMSTRGFLRAIATAWVRYAACFA